MAARRKLVPCLFDPELCSKRFVLDKGTWKGDTRKNLLLLFFDCPPWTLHNGPCRSNVRVVVALQEARTTRFEEVVLDDHPDSDNRLEPRLRVSGYGRVYLHRLAWWFKAGRRHRDFGGSWEAFQKDGRKVDHGSEGKPFCLNWHTLGLQTALESARQGPALAAKYAKRSGLGALQRKARYVRKRPARH